MRLQNMVLGYFFFVYRRTHEDNTSGHKMEKYPRYHVQIRIMYNIQFVTDQLPQCFLRKKRSVSHGVQYVGLKIIIFRSE